MINSKTFQQNFPLKMTNFNNKKKFGILNLTLYSTNQKNNKLKN